MNDWWITYGLILENGPTVATAKVVPMFARASSEAEAVGLWYMQFGEEYSDLEPKVRAEKCPDAVEKSDG